MIDVCEAMLCISGDYSGKHTVPNYATDCILRNSQMT